MSSQEHTDDEQAAQVPARRSPLQYSPAEIGEALALLDTYGGNALRAARELGIPRSTLIRWAREQAGLPAEVGRVRRLKREEFAAMADDAAEWVITSLTQADIDRAGLRDKSVSYGIYRDKAAQDDGEPTQVVEHRLTLIRKAYIEIKDLVPESEAIEMIAETFELVPADVARALKEAGGEGGNSSALILR